MFCLPVFEYKNLYNVHKILLLDLIVNQTTPVHTVTAYFMIHSSHLILLPYWCSVNVKPENLGSQHHALAH